MRKELRYTITGIVFAILLALLVARLFDLQFVQGEKHLAEAQDFSRKEIRLTGPRGKILDRNGLPLAYNKTSYSVQFVRDAKKTNSSDWAAYTRGLLLAMRIIEDNGGKFIATYAIQKLDDGTYDFIWPNINKANDPAAYKTRLDNWKKQNCVGTIKKTMTPQQIFEESMKFYSVPQDTSYEDAYKVLSVWQEIRATYYASYLPITLAENVDMKTVSRIETNLIDLPGVQINQGNSRVYRNKTMAAHIIGYMGRMPNEQTMVDNEKLGYKRNDLVGVSGIEKTQELELTGNTAERTGTKVIEVNSLGGIARELPGGDISPKPGNNVMLTIDSGMQKRLEEALAENIAQIRAAQETQYNGEKKAAYDIYLSDRANKNIQYATVGAAVIMDVQTGEVLAMASCPSYDLNIFSGGFATQEDFKKLMLDTRNPLFNNAISSRGTPGSVFKMCTGLAGLMEGTIALNTKIDDKGEYREHLKTGSTEKGPTCWAYPSTSLLAQHQGQTIIEGLKNSCNYFFFSVADNMGITKLNKWADLLGLTAKTNIELSGEVAGQVGNQSTLYSGPANMSGVAALVRNSIVKLVKDASKELGYSAPDDKYVEVAMQMLDLVNQGLDELGPDIRTILKNELKFTSEDIIRFNLSNEISMALTQIKWTRGYTIEAGIGQSVTMLTPIGVARYVSALVNGGNVYEAKIVKSIITPEGQERSNPPKLLRNLEVDPGYLTAIKQGMKEVVSSEERGSAAEAFKNYKYKDYMGGKTGTAQVNANIDLENNSWFVAFAPFDKPEIAIVVYIPNGYQGVLSSYTAKEMITYYMDKKLLPKAKETVPQLNTLIK